MGLELQFEDVLLVDAVRLFGGADGVAQQRKACQREVVLQPDTNLLIYKDPSASVVCLIFLFYFIQMK